MMSEKTTGYCGQHHQTISLDADCPGCEAEDAIREEYATQIGELEAQVAALEKDNDDIHELAEHYRVENGRLRELVSELADDVESAVMGDYCNPDGTLVHPAYQRRYDRDIEVVIRARAALSKPQ